MKKMNVCQMESIEGGWSYRQHAGCFLIGLGATVASAGIFGAAGYLGCLAFQDNKPFR